MECCVKSLQPSKLFKVLAAFQIIYLKGLPLANSSINPHADVMEAINQGATHSYIIYAQHQTAPSCSRPSG